MPAAAAAKEFEQRDLDHVVAIAPSGDEAARLRHVHPHARALIKMAGKRGKALGDEPDELRVELDRVDGRRAVQEREQDIRSAAGAEDQNVGLLQEMIRQRRRGEIEIVERLAPAVKGGDRGEPVAVCEDAKLGRWLCRVVKAQPWRMAERNGGTAHHRQQSERARVLGEHLCARDEERLAEPLVFGQVQRRP